jgi:crotonobetainyl-CoA:carnitine CoA-transferase CaiB-like acyl-CoA transferase
MSPEALDDPQVRHLQLLEEVEHAVAGKMRFVGPPVGYEHVDRQSSFPAPLLGEHSAALIRELGHDDDAIRQLQERGILRGPGET